MKEASMPRARDWSCISATTKDVYVRQHTPEFSWKHSLLKKNSVVFVNVSNQVSNASISYDFLTVEEFHDSETSENNYFDFYGGVSALHLHFYHMCVAICINSVCLVE